MTDEGVLLRAKPRDVFVHTQNECIKDIYIKGAAPIFFLAHLLLSGS
jgi:hypothetical protein